MINQMQIPGAGEGKEVKARRVFARRLHSGDAIDIEISARYKVWLLRRAQEQESITREDVWP
jgi:hypothetical protein